MTRPAVSNLPLSVHERLLNLSRERNEDFNLVVRRFALERLLYRLMVSGHADEFVLKGALLFTLWSEHLHRPTRDLDLLGLGSPSPERLRDVFRSVCLVSAEPDGSRATCSNSCT